MSQQHQKRWIGYLLVIVGASFWGIGGTVSQWLFQHANIEVSWFVAVRLIISGLLLIMIAFMTQGVKVFVIWWDKRAAVQMIIYGIFGMLAVQYTFMSSISHGNAAVATLLQYLGPIFIIFYLVMTKVTKFGVKEALAILLALSGTYLLLTNGHLENLQVPKPAIIWGLLSALALAFYTVYPVRLLARWGSLNVVGWGMLIGGIALSFVHPPWHVILSDWTLQTHLLFWFAIIFGTMLAFWFYIDSLHYLFPHEAGLLGTIEPLTALLTSVIWLNVSFGVWQLLGIVFIILMVVVLSVVKK
ncbi:EamA family transporter [Staphylococcus muscae]|uniref:Transporter YdeD n=1 Tax=Staphylococcus muscae TaxID=1294 RepID=A0A240C9D8_9STAP|nr:DMT family transporter [Staphylococcus muscae]AVQ33759.1 EamA family transporter [Staphylococcus muscae]PNZ06267.1 EamA family transporter [Staphylococcus muscae]GGA87518.1 putative transporter YdeD [Staphylococcus muscae]SNW04192.1 transporter, drug/metabolite exporter family [Staphylococcus muscae]